MPSCDYVRRPLMMRLPETMRRRLKREAERKNRSLNAEINRRLEESFDAVQDTRASTSDGRRRAR